MTRDVIIELSTSIICRALMTRSFLSSGSCSLTASVHQLDLHFTWRFQRSSITLCSLQWILLYIWHFHCVDSPYCLFQLHHSGNSCYFYTLLCFVFQVCLSAWIARHSSATVEKIDVPLSTGWKEKSLWKNWPDTLKKVKSGKWNFSPCHKRSVSGDKQRNFRRSRLKELNVHTCR